MKLNILLMALSGVLPALPAAAADSGAPAAGAKNPAVRLETIAGSPGKRVILAAKAAERLGIETSPVREELVVRRQMVGGLVTAPQNNTARTRAGGEPPGGFGRVAADSRRPAARGPNGPADGDAWVVVTLSRAEWESLAKDQPARLLPLAAADRPGEAILARPSGLAPAEDVKHAMLSLYYVVPGPSHGLTPNKRLRVELTMTGSDEKRRVVPYSAIYYDAKGAAWVYVNPQPLVFERQRVEVERVAGDLAVLRSGPPLGTPVVSVGAAMLYGTEIYGK